MPTFLEIFVRFHIDKFKCGRLFLFCNKIQNLDLNLFSGNERLFGITTAKGLMTGRCTEKRGRNVILDNDRRSITSICDEARSRGNHCLDICVIKLVREVWISVL